MRLQSRGRLVIDFGKGVSCNKCLQLGKLFVHIYLRSAFVHNARSAASTDAKVHCTPLPPNTISMRCTAVLPGAKGAPAMPRCRIFNYLAWGRCTLNVPLLVVHRSFPMPSPGIENRHCQAPKWLAVTHAEREYSVFTLVVCLFVCFLVFLFSCLFVCPGDISAIL